MLNISNYNEWNNIIMNRNDAIPHPNHTHTYMRKIRRARYANTLSVAEKFFRKLQTMVIVPNVFHPPK